MTHPSSLYAHKSTRMSTAQSEPQNPPNHNLLLLECKQEENNAFILYWLTFAFAFNCACTSQYYYIFIRSIYNKSLLAKCWQTFFFHYFLMHKARESKHSCRGAEWNHYEEDFRFAQLLSFFMYSNIQAIYSLFHVFSYRASSYER